MKYLIIVHCMSRFFLVCLLILSNYLIKRTLSTKNEEIFILDQKVRYNMIPLFNPFYVRPSSLCLLILMWRGDLICCYISLDSTFQKKMYVQIWICCSLHCYIYCLGINVNLSSYLLVFFIIRSWQWNILKKN